MLSTPHLLLGGSVGLLLAPVGWPAALLGGVVSHLILDGLPHTDDYLLFGSGGQTIGPRDYPQVIGDILLGCLVVGGIAFIHSPTQFAPIIAGAIGGLLPDLLGNVPFWNGINKWPFLKQFYAAHEWINKMYENSWHLFGIDTQFAVVILSMIILLRK